MIIPHRLGLDPQTWDSDLGKKSDLSLFSLSSPPASKSFRDISSSASSPPHVSLRYPPVPRPKVACDHFFHLLLVGVTRLTICKRLELPPLPILLRCQGLYSVRGLLDAFVLFRSPVLHAEYIGGYSAAPIALLLCHAQVVDWNVLSGDLEGWDLV